MLANKWGFASLGALAAKHIFPLASAVDRITLGRKYEFQSWLLEAFVEVCQRPEPLALQEACRLSVEDYVRIGQTREAIVRNQLTAEKIREMVTMTFGMPASVESAHASGESNSTQLKQTANLRPEPYMEQLDFDSYVMSTTNPMDPCLSKITAALLICREQRSTFPSDEIIQLVLASDMSRITFVRLYALIIPEAICNIEDTLASQSRTPDIVSFCVKLVESTTHTRLAHPDPFDSRELLNAYCRYLLSRYDTPSFWERAYIDNNFPKRLITFLVYLHRRSLLEDVTMQQCCLKLVQLPPNPSFEHIKNVARHFESYTEILSLSVVTDVIQPVLRSLDYLKYSWEYRNAVHYISVR